MSAIPAPPASSEVEARTRTTEELMCLPGRGLTITELLRVLDVLRRRLARNTRGREGAFAGFDALDVAGWQEGAEDERILFSARLVTNGSATQVVDYEATKCAHVGGACLQTGTRDAYVRATGTTVGLAPRTAPNSPTSTLFTIASPHR